jgi:autotransporter-associated beta strand protein
MSKKLNHSLAIGILQIGILLSFISEGLSQTTNYFTWNNSTNTWSTTTAWTPNGGPQSSSATANTNVAVFAATGAGNNTALLGSDRTVYGLIFTNGANAYTIGSVSTPKQLDIMFNMGLQNVSGQNQIFNLAVANSTGNGVWSNSSGSTTTFNNGINLTTASSTANRTLTLGGAGTWNVASTIANGGAATNPATAGAVTVTATGTTTLSGNNTYDGKTTMNALGGTLTLSGNNSGAAGGVTLTAGTLNLNNANAVGTGVLDLGVVTGSSIGSSIINNTSGGALTYLGLSGVVWTGVNPAGIQFGTSGSTSANNMDFGSGLVTAATDRSMNIAGTGVTISMGTLTASGTAGSYTYKIDGVGNTLDLDGWRISGAATPTQAVQHKISGTANVNIGTIENGTGAFANSAVFMTDGTTRLTGNNTYTGTTEFTGSGTNIISGNNSAAVGNVKIAGDTGKTPVVRLDNVNGISSSSSLLGASGTAQIGTLDLRAAGNFSLNSFGTVVAAGNNMIFTNSSGSQKTLAFTAANNYITTATTGGRTLYNNSENLLLDFDGNIEIGGTSAAAEATTFAGVGNFNVDGNLTDTGSGLTRTLRKTGDGTLTLRGSANSIRGSTLLERGQLDLYGSVTASTNIVVSTSGAVSATSTTRTATATLDVKSGGSLLNNSTTTVYSGGNLIVNGTAGAVVLENNGLLGGSGAVGNVELKSGSLLNPGNSPGLLTAASSSWAAGSTYNWEIDQASGGTAGVNWDVFSVVGALDLSALSSTAQMNLVLNSLPSMDDFSSTAAYSWVIAQAGSFIGTGLADGTNVTDLFNINATAFNGGLAADLPNGGFKVEVGTDANNLRTLNLMAIPEPSTGSLMMFGLSGLVLTRLLRRKVS